MLPAVALLNESNSLNNPRLRGLQLPRPHPFHSLMPGPCRPLLPKPPGSVQRSHEGAISHAAQAQTALERLAACGHTAAATALARTMLLLPNCDSGWTCYMGLSGHRDRPEGKWRRRGAWWRFTAAWGGAEWLLHLEVQTELDAAGVAGRMISSLQDRTGRWPQQRQGWRGGAAQATARDNMGLGEQAGGAAAAARSVGGKAARKVAVKTVRKECLPAPAAIGDGGVAAAEEVVQEEVELLSAGGHDDVGALAAMMHDLLEWRWRDGEGQGQLPGGLGSALADLARSVMWRSRYHSGSSGATSSINSGHRDGGVWRVSATLAALGWFAAVGEQVMRRDNKRCQLGCGAMLYDGCEGAAGFRAPASFEEGWKLCITAHDKWLGVDGEPWLQTFAWIPWSLEFTLLLYSACLNKLPASVHMIVSRAPFASAQIHWLWLFLCLSRRRGCDSCLIAIGCISTSRTSAYMGSQDFLSLNVGAQAIEALTPSGSPADRHHKPLPLPPFCTALPSSPIHQACQPLNCWVSLMTLAPLSWFCGALTPSGSCGDTSPNSNAAWNTSSGRGAAKWARGWQGKVAQAMTRPATVVMVRCMIFGL